MLGARLAHHGLGDVEEQYSWYAMYCGSKKPTAMQHPPTPTAANRLIFGTDNPFLTLHATSTASSAKMMPFSSELLLTVVDSPSVTPASTANPSCFADETGPAGTLQAKTRSPAKVKNAAVLSPHGAERKIPAGETMCKHPAIKASCGPDGPGKMAQDRWYSAKTDRP